MNKINDIIVLSPIDFILKIEDENDDWHWNKIKRLRDTPFSPWYGRDGKIYFHGSAW